MLHELAANTTQIFAIASTLFFFIIFTGVAIRVLTRRRGTYDATARLPLEGDHGSTLHDDSSAGGR